MYYRMAPLVKNETTFSGNARANITNRFERSNSFNFLYPDNELSFNLVEKKKISP